MLFDWWTDIQNDMNVSFLYKFLRAREEPFYHEIWFSSTGFPFMKFSIVYLINEVLLTFPFTEKNNWSQQCKIKWMKWWSNWNKISTWRLGMKNTMTMETYWNPYLILNTHTLHPQRPHGLFSGFILFYKNKNNWKKVEKMKKIMKNND